MEPGFGVELFLTPPVFRRRFWGALTASGNHDDNTRNIEVLSNKKEPPAPSPHSPASAEASANISMRLRRLTAAALALLATLCLPLSTQAEQFRVGTWKTAQTIQPFFYQEFLAKGDTVTVFPFTNPADQKTALLAGSLDMTGTTLAHAIQSAVMGQPVVVVAALCNKCSALVVRKDGPVHQVADLKGLKIGYVPGTMHEILLRELLTRNGLSPMTDVTLVRVDFFDMGTALEHGCGLCPPDQGAGGTDAGLRSN
jgi:hypothetical protein